MMTDDRIKLLLERDATTLTVDEIRTLQWELGRYRKFWAASTRYGTRFVIDERHYAAGIADEVITHHERRAAAELGEAIAKDRAWLELARDDNRLGSEFRLDVVVWPEKFPIRKDPTE